jgi:dTDP-4-amino-4,6-dideoxygalactose transaminase
LEQRRIIPFFKLSLDEREIDEVIRVLRKGYLTQGKEVRMLEKDFSRYVGCRYAVAVDSCTNGLFLSLKCNGIGEGDRVTIPSLTFASVANVILQTGAKLEWEDKVYVGSAYYLKNNRPFKIVDSAHQVERAIYHDFRGTMMVFSFYPTKQISSAEGGMICLNDHHTMEWLEECRWHGRKGGGFAYSVNRVGWKFNMTDIQAVIAMVQLHKLDDMNRKRRQIVAHYNKELGENVESLHLYTIDVDNRDKFIAFMDEKGINCSVHYYTPLHLQPAYEEFKRSLPLTEYKANHTVSLPLFPDMTEEEVDYVIEAVKEWREYEGSGELDNSGDGGNRTRALQGATR